MTTLHVLAGISWTPTIRGILVVAVGVAVLMGSVYVLLATNTGSRLGFLIATAGFFGWMTLMGTSWWIYGIGMQGESPKWEVIEVNTGDLSQASLDDARSLDTSELPEPDVLNDALPEDFAELKQELEPTLGGSWRLLPESDPQRGEAQAAIDEHFADADYPGIEGPSDYLALYGFDKGGKPRLGDGPDRIDRIRNWFTNAARIKHPSHFAIIQIQPVVEVEVEPGEVPPSPEPDPDRPVISVIMERDLGDKRFPAAMITLSSGAIFGLLCYLLHIRDRRVDEHLALAAAGT